MLKKIVSLLITLSVVSGFTSVFAEGEDVKVILNGEELIFDVPAQIINDRTMVPMRKIFESMSAEVEWAEDTRTVTASKDDICVIMQIDNNIIMVNDEEIELDVPPMIVEDRTLVPVRAVAESFEADVEWDGDARTVVITKTEPVAKLFIDPQLKMMSVINNMDWVKVWDAESGQVYFYNEADGFEKGNLISMSSYSYSGDVEEEFDRIWEFMIENHATVSSKVTVTYKDRSQILVGGAYKGYIYPFEATTDDETIVCNAVLWSAGEQVYICTTTADIEAVDEVQGVLDGLLERFMWME